MLRRAQGQVAVLAALAVNYVKDHALAVDVGDLQPGDLGAAHARAVGHHQQGALEQAAAGLDQPGHFLPAQDVGQLPARLGIGQELAELMPMQSAHEEEPQCRDAVLDRSRAELPLLEQIRLVAAQMLQAKLVGGLAKVFCELLHEAQIVANGGLGVVTTLESFEHHFA